MRVFPVVLGCALAVVVGQLAWSVDHTGQGVGRLGVAAVFAAGPAATDTPSVQARDKNGNPMTDAEYQKAYDARMAARAAATMNRLETKQAKWKKGPKKPAPKKALGAGAPGGSAPQPGAAAN